MSSISNLNRMSGLMSGLDTETLIKAMTANTKARIDAQKQKLQTLQWKQEAYRSVISKISDFKDKYLNILSPTSIKAQAIMNKYVASSSNDKIISATAAAGATPATYTISQASKAQSAKFTSNGSVAAGAINLDFSKNVQDQPYTVEMELDGTKKTVTFRGGADEKESRDNFLNAVNDAFSDVRGKGEFAWKDGDSNALVFNGKESKNVLHTFSVGYNSKGVGLSSTAYSRISASATLGSVNFAQELKSDDGKYNININGIDFEFNENTTISEMMNTINKSDAGVKMSFSSVSQSFTLETKEKGSAAELNVYQANGNLLNALFNWDESGAGATNASKANVTYNVISSEPYGGLLTNKMINQLRRGFDEDSEGGIYTIGVKDADGNEYMLELDLKSILTKKADAVKDEDGEIITEAEPNYTSDEIADAFNEAFKKAYLQNKLGDDFDEDAYSSDSTIYDDQYSYDNVFNYDGTFGILSVDTGVKDLYIETDENLGEFTNYITYKATNTYVFEGVNELNFTTADGENITVKAKENAKGISIQDLVNAGVVKMPANGMIVAAADLSAADDATKAFLTDLFGTDSLTGVKMQSDYGQNATLTISSDGENFTTYTSASDLFEFDGTTIDVSKSGDFNAESEDDYITVEVTKDTSGIMDVIKGFVNDYNTLLADLYKETSTSRPKSKGEYYDPLTDEMEDEMSEKEIEKWNENAKTGLLYNDRNVMNFVSSLRNAMSTYVEGFGLADMGITLTGDWKENGKLEINESKLESAINAYEDKVTDFFTKASEGLAAKLEGVVDNAISTNSTGYGYLSALAGIEGTRTNTDNQIYRQMKSIQDLIDRLNEKYEKEQSRYWSKFTALETYMAKMQSQMSYFTDNSTTQ